MTVATHAARAAFDELQPRLKLVSERARKLLVQVGEMAYEVKLARRAPDTAYLPELYDSCGIGVEEMYPLLQELNAAKLVELEGAYPFEDVHVPKAGNGSIPLADLAHYCDEHQVPLRDVVVDLRGELLQ
jgi:hypothetical protein